MRVCWFSNVPLSAACVALGMRVPVGGGWLSSLANALMRTGQIQLVVISVVPGRESGDVVVDGTRHRCIAIRPYRYFQEVSYGFSSSVRRECWHAVESFKPDVVHINGTEHYYGSLFTASNQPYPIVVSLQGIVQAIGRYFNADLSPTDRYWNMSLSGALSQSVLCSSARQFRRRAQKIEKRILAIDALFTGRTLFDRAYLHAANPAARYRPCERILREGFYGVSRRPEDVRRHSVFTVASNYPLKGVHCLLKAVALLARQFPHITVRIPGRPFDSGVCQSGYEKYLRRLVRDLNLQDSVVCLGKLSEDQVVEELAHAHVFAFPSFADNSSNSLAEALAVGVPTVAAFAGGTPSLAQDGETALCFPSGDDVVMAECIRTLFEDEKLAQKLGKNARIRAMNRHDPSRIALDMLDIYREAIDSKKSYTPSEGNV